MSDQTIRLSSCRQDGRCPVCEAAGWITNSPTKGRVSVWRGIPCGCTICSGYACVTEHTRDLLTEAIRQRDAYDAEVKHVEGPLDEIAALCGCPEWEYPGQVIRDVKALREERDAAIRERDLARAHDTQPYPTSEAYERVCAALEATKRSLEQTRAAMEAGDACTVCAGTGKAVSGKPCICGGHGGIGNQIIGLTREVQRERERADRAEALLAEARTEHRDISERYIAASSARIRAEALLRECQQYMGGLGLGRRGQELLAKIRETTKVEES